MTSKAGVPESAVVFNSERIKYVRDEAWKLRDNTVELLRSGIDVIKRDGWTKGSFGELEGMPHCMMGAIGHRCYMDPVSDDAVRLLSEAIVTKYGKEVDQALGYSPDGSANPNGVGRVTRFNDRQGVSLGDVFEVFCIAIDAAVERDELAAAERAEIAKDIETVNEITDTDDDGTVRVG